MTKGSFKISRENGKSDRAVIVELAKNAKPGTLFSHEQIVAALSEGTDRKITVAVACAAVRAANTLLLKEEQHCLSSIKGVGYRIAHAFEHRSLAKDRTRRADRQIDKGLQVLQNVRRDEMTAEQREQHDRALTSVAVLSQMMKSANDRRSRLDRAIKN